MKSVFIFIVRIYQLAISPLFPPVCRFEPSCSEYAVQAIEKYGVLRGSLKALRRLLRCHPFSKKFGYDPVSEPAE
ncbi:membrane protein insertion efficiency factor YidD [candidate division KSB1 bacterium]